MKLLSQLSPKKPALPAPADARQQALGQDAWDAALDAAGADADPARTWSTTPAGQTLLAAIFGNSPFLTSAAVREWQFLTRLVEDGADTVFEALIADIKQPIEGEDRRR
jgi:[glutamine synthetase] adenylyltransferase / [glutamine synthetase]-adenylyl-L-tyrosine phosphorylase